MDERGFLSPATEAEAREHYRELGPAAQTVTREAAKAMAFDRAEYGERVTSEVVETARDALFASLLSVTLGTRAEYEAFRDAHPNLDVFENGSENVSHVAWHVVEFADSVVATTYENEPEAAAATLRRVAHGRFYSELVRPPAKE